MKVAAIIDCYTVAIKRDEGDSHRLDELLAIYEPISDPETGETIGGYEKVRIKVTNVQEKVLIAETYRDIPRQNFPAYSDRRQKIVNSPVVEVNVGDIVAEQGLQI